MSRTGAVVGTALALAAVLLIGLYSTGDRTMPDWLFWASWSVIVGVILLGTPVWLFIWVIAPVLRFHKSHRYLVSKDAPNPDQWLLEIAKEHADNPTQLLLITDRRVTKMDLSSDIPMPWIELAVDLLNCNVHTVSVAGTIGRARFHGKELPEPIIGNTGKSNKPRGHGHPYTMKQYLPPDFAAQIYEEVAEETKICGGE